MEEFPSIISKVIDKCLALKEVDAAFIEVLHWIKTADKGADDMSEKYRTSSDCWLIKFELMTYFLEKADERTFSLDTIKVARILVETLAPIKV